MQSDSSRSSEIDLWSLDQAADRNEAVALYDDCEDPIKAKDGLQITNDSFTAWLISAALSDTQVEDQECQIPQIEEYHRTDVAQHVFGLDPELVEALSVRFCYWLVKSCLNHGVGIIEVESCHLEERFVEVYGAAWQSDVHQRQQYKELLWVNHRPQLVQRCGKENIQHKVSSEDQFLRILKLLQRSHEVPTRSVIWFLAGHLLSKNEDLVILFKFSRSPLLLSLWFRGLTHVKWLSFHGEEEWAAVEYHQSFVPLLKPHRDVLRILKVDLNEKLVGPKHIDTPRVSQFW